MQYMDASSKSQQERAAAFKVQYTPWGYPWLEGPRKTKVEEANLLMMRTIAAVEAAGMSDTPLAFEFPEDLGKHLGETPASPWRLPEVSKVAENINARRVAIHQRDYGTPYLKPTGFLLTLDEDPILWGGRLATRG